ncbi:MAG: 16S rRNA (cytidine(1402)-2'-O)-methyltransferase [Granulosicoccus sp.]
MSVILAFIGVSGSGDADGVTQADKALASSSTIAHRRKVEFIMLSEQILYIVATPIGNRDDISARAIDVLGSVNRIYAEDTRHSLPLLRHHGIDTPVTAFHEHNEQAQVDAVLTYLHNGHSAALISDAGTPLISDPGFRLVKACQQSGIKVSPVPGACALTAALCVSGVPTDRFQFVGFSPHKRGARKAWMQPLANLPHTLVLYESPHRIVECLQDICEVFGSERELCVARELTKRFETVVHGTSTDMLARVSGDANQQRGEFVIVITGKLVSPEATVESVLQLDKTLSVLLEHLPVKTAAKAAADIFSINKRDAYERALVLQGKQAPGLL